MFNIFKRKPKSCVGIDIGTSSIKVVELRGKEKHYKLETYGELQTYAFIERLNDPFQTKSLKMLESQVIELTGKLLREAEVSTKNAAISIPVFSSFVSVIDMSPISEKELPQALIFEAKRYIPLPLNEVRIDWEVIGKEKADSEKLGKKDLFKFRILLIAVPREAIDRFLRIARGLKLNLLALELESFSYTRSLVGTDPSPTCILDFGARSTSFTIVDRGFIQMSHGLDLAGFELTRALSHGMGVEFKRAEAYKRERGLNRLETESGREIKEILLTLIDKIIIEVERMINIYTTQTNRKITKLILSGGSANLIGLDKYLEDKLKMNVIIGNPWARIAFPPFIEPALKEIAPKFAVAVGLAMREL